jgi:hypothetical protein
MPSARVYPLNRDPLHLVERDLVAGAIVELGGARTFMRGHGLSIFYSAAGFEIGGDARGAEAVIADRCVNAGSDRAPGLPGPQGPSATAATKIATQFAGMRWEKER